LRNPHVESGNASREIPAKKDQDQEPAKLVRFKTCKQGKTTTISIISLEDAKAVLSNYLSEDECERLKNAANKTAVSK
jgi:hypothetical protein